MSAMLPLDRYVVAIPVIEATDTPTNPPDANTLPFDSGNHSVVATYLTFAGTVTEATIQLWVHNGKAWFKGEEGTVSGDDGNIAIDWHLGRRQRFAFQITQISGGGTLAVDMLGR